jgi:hypothetical protein
VFRDFLLDLLNWDETCFILLLDCCSQLQNISWVPDWRTAASTYWLPEEYICGLSSITATPGSHVQFKSTLDKDGLLVYGVNPRSTRVTWVPSPMESGSRPVSELQNMGSLLEWIRIGSYQRARTVKDVLETLEADMEFKGATEDDFWAWFNIV